jgi:hypothetical protein
MERIRRLENSGSFYLKPSFCVNVFWFVTALISMIVLGVMAHRVDDGFWPGCRGRSAFGLLVTALFFMIVAFLLYALYLVTSLSSESFKIAWMARIWSFLVKIRLWIFISAMISAVLCLVLGFTCAAKDGSKKGDVEIKPLMVSCTKIRDAMTLVRLQAWLENHLFGETYPSLDEQRKAGEKYQAHRTSHMRAGVSVILFFFLIAEICCILIFVALLGGEKKEASQPPQSA